MVEDKTVFILGAGSNVPYGFPTGGDLNKYIDKNLMKLISNWSTGYYLYQVDERQHEIRRLERETSKFRTCFHRGPGPSIDRFLKDNPSLLYPGKLAIILSILEKERNSRFLFEIKDEELKKQDWYSDLFNELISDFKGANSFQINNKINFITFNYDRSLEYFLYTNLINHYNDDDENTLIQQLRQIQIIHVYGKTGNLPWQVEEKKDSLPYKPKYTDYHPDKFLKNIYIIDDERDNPNIEVAKKLIRDSERVFFLGFGFAQENLDILDIPNILIKKDLYATTIGLTHRRLAEIRIFLRALRPIPHFHPVNEDCVKLLEEYFLTYR